MMEFSSVIGDTSFCLSGDEIAANGAALLQGGWPWTREREGKKRETYRGNR